MFTPATTASKTSEPPVISLKALATQVTPCGSLDLFPLAAEMTTGRTFTLRRMEGACPRAGRAEVASAPSPAEATNFLRVTRLFIGGLEMQCGHLASANWPLIAACGACGRRSDLLVALPMQAA